MTNTTQKNLTTRVEALESDVSDIKGGVRAILDHLQGKAVAAPATQALSAPVVTGEVVASSTEPTKGKGKGKKARKTTTRKPVVNGAIEGKRCLTRKNRTMFVADHDWAKALPSSEQGTANLAKLALAGAPLVGNWAIGPRTTERLGGGTTATTVVVAETSASAPAKVYRRANGTIAPKSEYTLRAALEGQGLSRKAVDKKVRKAQKVLASA